MTVDDSQRTSFLDRLRTRSPKFGALCSGLLAAVLIGGCDGEGGDDGDDRGDGGGSLSDGGTDSGGGGSASGPGATASGGGGSAGNPSGDPSGGLPSDAAVDDCRDACDTLQFFDCIGAPKHEECWLACADRPESEGELFEACVDNEAPECNNTCLERFLDTAPVDPTGSSSGGCVSACGAYFAAGCDLPDYEGFEGCEDICSFLGEAAGNQLAACLDPATCGADENCFGGGEGGEEGGEGGGGEGG